MKLARLIFPFFCLAFVLLSGCGLVVSESREVRRMQNNFVARLNLGKWDGTKALASPTFTFIDEKGVEHKSTPENNQIDYYNQLIKEVQGRGMVDYEFVRTSKLNDSTYLIKVKMQIRLVDAMHSSNILWESSFKWVKISNLWKLEEVKDTTPRTRVVGD